MLRVEFWFVEGRVLVWQRQRQRQRKEETERDRDKQTTKRKFKKTTKHRPGHIQVFWISPNTYLNP